jgi:hypothetical protein
MCVAQNPQNFRHQTDFAHLNEKLMGFSTPYIRAVTDIPLSVAFKWCTNCIYLLSRLSFAWSHVLYAQTINLA